MIHLYFVRHAQSDHNASVETDGERPLTPEGRQDSRAVTELLQNLNVSAYYCSPYRRSLDTIMESAQKHGLDVHTDERLRERRSGKNGNAIHWFRKRWMDFSSHEPGGESLEQTQARNIAAVREILQKHRDGETVVIGTHGTALSTVLHYYDNRFGCEDFIRIIDYMPYVIRLDFEKQQCVGKEELLFVDKEYKGPNAIREIIRRTESFRTGLHSHNMRLTDDEGREVLLNGINFVCKDKNLGYVNPCGRELFSQFRRDGINVLRMGLIWDGVEPEPGRYDDEYLRKIHRQVEWAAEEGIRVFLDMHQDLYGVEYGDGAPSWATLSGGKPHVPTEHWSDAYLESPAVMESFDRFWENAPVSISGGMKEDAEAMGVQDYFAKMWAHVTAFFADCPNVFGYDFLNEPYPGTSGRKIMGNMLAAAGEFLPDDLLKAAGYTREDISDPLKRTTAVQALWEDSGKRWRLLSLLNDIHVYRTLTDAAKACNQAFEKERLSPLYERVWKTVCRECPPAARNHVLLETSYFCNMAVESGVQPLKEDINRQTDQIYAPHAYDFVVDTDAYEQYSSKRIQFILDTHRKVQERLDMPLLLGEWGGFPHKEATYGLALDILRTIEKYLWSHTYWCWYPGVEEGPYWKALRRAYPMAVAGQLRSYRWDPEDQYFTMSFIPREGETVVFHPYARNLQKEDVLLNGAGTVSFQLQSGEESGLIILQLPAVAAERRIAIRKPSK